MKRTKRALTLLVLAVTVGCSKQISPATPPPEAVVLQIQSTLDAAPLLERLGQNFLELNPNFHILSSSDSQSNLLENLMQGETDYFLSHHLPIEIGDYWAAPLAQDALVLVVHPSNPLNNLSSADLRRIYRGYVMNWQDLGSYDTNIALYSRDKDIAIRLEFERLVMGQERTSPNALVLPSSESVLQRVATEPNAIAYLPLSLLSEGIKVLSIDGVLPSLETINSNRYPLRTSLYIIGLNPPAPAYQFFIAWVQGIEGQLQLGTQYAPLPP